MTAEHVGVLSRKPKTLFATGAIACFAYSAFVLLLMHVLRSDLSPVSHYISEYALGRYGWMMETSFLVGGVGCLMLLLGLIHFGIRSWVAWLGAFLLGVEFLGSVVAVVCPMDPPGGPRTLAGQIHDINFYVDIGSFSLAVLLLTAGSWNDTRWRASRGMMTILASLYVVAVILQVLTERPGMPYGLANRFVFATLVAWTLAAAIQLRSLTRHSYKGT